MGKGYCKVCCKDISHKKVSAIYCSSQCARIGNRLKQPTYTCTYCGKKYKPLEKKRAKDKTDYTFCSISCKTTFLNNGNIQSNEWENIKLIRSNLSEVVKFVKDKFYVRKTYNKICPITGEEFITTYKNTKYSKEGARKINIFRSLRNHSKKWIDDKKHIRKCFVCGDKYIKMLGDNNNMCTCSDECQDIFKTESRHNIKSRRRLRIKKNGGFEFIIRDLVFESDKYECQICGRKTKRSLRGTSEDLAPELDHVIPLSMGGKHIYSNVQTLCRRCNIKKSDNLFYIDDEFGIKIIRGRAVQEDKKE